MSDALRRLARAFEAGEIDPAGFRHREHVAVAHELLRAHEFSEAAARYSAGLRAIAAKAGAPQKFNTTITLAFLGLIAERMAATPHQDFDAFLADNADLLAKDLLLGWYSPERLGSDLARRIFLMPEVAGRA